jgi:FKBP-type peptidyl-prolyl cis-trans isomerase
VPTNKQKREAARRHLERQLQRRAERDAARRRFTMIASIVGTIVLVAVVVIAVVMLTNDNSKPSAKSSAPSTPPPSSASTTPSTHYPAAKGSTVNFDGVTVTGAEDLSGYPTVTAKNAAPATKLEVKDLVVGKGAPATPASTVTVNYVGILYSDGTVFDSSWNRGMPSDIPLTGVLPGFTQGIGGTTGVAPMKVGGRRVIIIPPALGYGAQQNGTIPPNSTLVFVIDLLKLTAATG